MGLCLTGAIPFILPPILPQTVRKQKKRSCERAK